MNMDQLMKGEVRRVHVLYFLSRNGAVEQPHLIRIHHLHRNGVYLRDVKRWLADLRGKEMPDCFSWSYKRRYKSDFVWQDLTDDELITPFSDNEYVLKGSEISSSYQTSSRDTNASDEDEKETPPPPPHSGSDISNESAKHATSIINIDFWKQELEEKKNELKSECTSSDRISSKEQISSNNSKVRSSGKSSKLLRSLFHCGGVDTDGSGMRIIQRNKKYHAVNGSSYKSMDEYLKNEKPRTRRSNTM